jgi:hypothetical protein
MSELAHDAPFWVAQVGPAEWEKEGEVGIGDRGLVRFMGYYAGPFDTYEEADEALQELLADEGPDSTLLVYAEGSNHFYADRML